MVKSRQAFAIAMSSFVLLWTTAEHRIQARQ